MPHPGRGPWVGIARGCNRSYGHGMLPTHEIRTLAEFRALTALPLGVVVITDSAGPSRSHVAGCRWLNEDSFTEKVLENRARNGAYYFFLRRDDIPNVAACGHCVG